MQYGKDRNGDYRYKIFAVYGVQHKRGAGEYTQANEHAAVGYSAIIHYPSYVVRQTRYSGKDYIRREPKLFCRGVFYRAQRCQSKHLKDGGKNIEYFRL